MSLKNKETRVQRKKNNFKKTIAKILLLNTLKLGFW